MTVELSERVIEMVCEVAFSDIHALKSKLETYEQSQRNVIPPNVETKRKRIESKINDIKKAIETAEGVHGLFTEFLEQAKQK